MPSDQSAETVQQTTDLNQLRAAGNIDSAGHTCSYCRLLKHDCRPVAVVNREHIPALCDECYSALDEAGRLDRERDREVFHP